MRQTPNALSSEPEYTKHLNLNLPGVRPLYLDPLPDLRGSTALVTGGATGIGRGISLQLARAGATVAMHWVSEETEMKETVERFKSENRKAGSIIPLRADFTSDSGVQDLFAATVKELGKINTLVNNAGNTRNLPLADWTAEQIEKILRVNVVAPMRLTQLVGEHMKAEKIRGEIINLTSPHAYDSMSEHAMYAATKAAVARFSSSSMVDLVDHTVGIRVNAIISGWVLVDNHISAMGEDGGFSSAGRAIPQGRQSALEEIGTFVAQLAAGGHPYFHGTPIPLDGGLMSRWRRDTPLPETAGTVRFGTKYL